MSKIFQRVKSGFTVIELIIVIAVVAVLTGILVPTFVHLSHQANKSNDAALVKELNTSLAIGKAEGKKFNVFDEVADYVVDHGFPLDSIKSKSGGDIVWDSITHEFVFIENVADEEAPARYYSIFDEIPDIEDQVYSIYLNNTELDLSDVTVRVGFDPGKNETLQSLTYENSDGPQEVTIRTNSLACNFTVNAPNDTVHHYGDSNYVTITSISNSSYYEGGYSEFTMIDAGRIILLPNTHTGGIFLRGSSIILAKTNDAEFPIITRNSSATSGTVQIVDVFGETLLSSTFLIKKSKITFTGNVPSDITSPIGNSILSTTAENTARMAAKYVVRVGAATVGVETNFYRSIEEAFSSNMSITSTTTFYLLRNVQTTRTINISGKAGGTFTFALGAFNIEGIGCSPLAVSITNKNFAISSGGGKLIAPTGYPALTYDASGETRYLTLSKVNTNGAIRNMSSGYGYIRVNGGDHYEWSCSGRVVLCVNSYVGKFDSDPSSTANLMRSQITYADGLWSVSLKEQDTTKPFMNAYDKVTRYSTVEEALQYDDFPILYLKYLVNNDTLNLELDITYPIYFALGNIGDPTTDQPTNELSLSLKTKGAVTFLYGTYTISNIECTSLTASTSSTVTIRNGDVTNKATASTSTSVLTIEGGTFGNGVSIIKTSQAKLTITGGMFNGGFSYTNSGSKKCKTYIRGGTYLTSVFSTYSAVMETTYKGVNNGDGTTTVVAK